MSSILGVMRSIAGLASVAGALLLAGVVWLFAPLVPSAETLPVRLGLSLLPVLALIVGVVLVARRRSKRDAALVKGITQDPAETTDPREEALRGEEASVSERLAEALQALRTAAGRTGGYLYERPWYVIIGPPGSGKTTAIQNAGLEFPLSVGRLPGVGGTRNCDWWVSEQMVLVDTAGRYTTQDSDAVADKAGWERFLDLLRRERPRQPLNGIIVAFGVDLLSRIDQSERERHALAVRRRVKELEGKLGQRLPVYLLVTKADLIVGFSEYFADLDRSSRTQVWGITFTAKDQTGSPVASFGEEFSLLVQRVQDRLLERLQSERGPEQRARIAGFPAQFASLEPVLTSFLQGAFGGSRLDPGLFLRGVYLTSGTQEGTPIDRLTGALSRSFGLDPRRPAAQATEKGRSYFLGRLLKEVILGEAQLAAGQRGLEKRRVAIQAAAWSAALLVLAGGGFLGWRASTAETRRSEAVQAAIAKADAASRGLNLDPVSPADDLLRVVPYLDSTRAVITAAGGEAGVPGLNQQEKLVSAAEGAYARVLDRVLLPRLLVRLEEQIRGSMQRADLLYEATRIYLMLGRQGPLDRVLVREWMKLDWAQSYPGAIQAPQRDSLAQHLDSLLDTDFSAYPLDGPLVDQARRVFSRLPMAVRVYGRLKTANLDLPPWKPGDALGPAGRRWFALASGKPLDDAAVPGFFTATGFNKGLLPKLPQAIVEAASESWVFGPQAVAALAGDPRQLEAAILRLYGEDYVRAWQAMLNDIVLPPFKSLQQAAEALNLLGAPNSPMRDLLQSASQQLSLAPPAPAPGTNAPGTGAGGAAGGAGAAVQGTAERLGSLLGSAPAAATQIVDDRFKALRDISGKPLDGILANINDLYVQVARLAASPPGTVLPPAPGLDPGQKLASEAQRAPEPLSRWLQAIAQSTAGVRLGGTKAAIAAAAAQSLAPFCRGLETRFPFNRDANAPEVSFEQFSRLFAKGGAFEQFFAQHLRNYVDTTSRPWKPMAGEGLAAPVSPRDIEAFQRAATIQEAFFPSGTGGRIELVLQRVDPVTRAVTIEASGAKTNFVVGVPSQRLIALQWPSQGPISIVFDPPSSVGPLITEGSWAALKFIAKGRVSARGQGRYQFLLQQGERSLEFELQAPDVNPFSLRDLSEFRCPTFSP